jgi:MerR family redox-sensitive transcriptional activator SoxR
MNEAELTIGEVAKRAGIATSAIRFYERVGVLPQAGRTNGRRRYGPETVDRLATIGVAQRAGLNLEEIGALLQSSDQGTASERLKELARRKLPEIEDLIARAEAMREWLLMAEECGCPTVDVCDLFRRPALDRPPAGAVDHPHHFGSGA